MSLLSSVQQACKETGLLIPSTLIGNTDDEHAVRMLAAAERAGQFLGRIAFPEMVKTQTVTTVASTANYAFESDFLKFVPETSWNVTNTRRMAQAISPQDWRRLQNGSISISAITDVWRVTKDSSDNRQFSVYPTPAAVESLLFEYVMNTWCESAAGAAQTTWTADTDVPIFPDYLLQLEVVWRALKAAGMPYAEEYAEARDELEKEKATSSGARILSLNGPDLRDPLEYVNVAEGNFTL